MLAQARADQMQQRAAAVRPSSSSSNTAALAKEQDQGYWTYMQNQLAERTQRLGSVNDGMDSLEQTTSTWLGDVNKFVNKQKKNAVTGGKFCYLNSVLSPQLHFELEFVLTVDDSDQVEVRVLGNCTCAAARAARDITLRPSPLRDR